MTANPSLNPQSSSGQLEAAAPQISLLDSIISESRMARSETERTRTRDLIGELVGQALGKRSINPI